MSKKLQRRCRTATLDDVKNYDPKVKHIVSIFGGTGSGKSIAILEIVKAQQALIAATRATRKARKKGAVKKVAQKKRPVDSSGDDLAPPLRANMSETLLVA